ncbi:hypothetical protein [Desulfatibacillum aliphaticivorans]|uniref:hypothetical protein n=1 Tax=Desulfatibacillum aliphaticivorans TaxID=218208 RepID=UPI0003F562A6|nr:hypothetical protein [Desulfatibacillum aliphaticivorans]
MEIFFVFVWGLIIGAAGIYAVVRPQKTAEKIKNFYSKYPLIHYAGDRQLTARPGYVKAIGGVFIAMSVFFIVVLFTKGLP